MTYPCDLVFVYGTLRRGGSNHFRMEGAEFLATATVRGRLYQIDWYPGLILDEAGDGITGEIYQISPVMLERLDAFEGMEYRRVMTNAQSGGHIPSPLSVWLWEWLGPCEENQRITNGDWISPLYRAKSD